MKPAATFIFLFALCFSLGPQEIVAHRTKVRKLTRLVCKDSVERDLCVSSPVSNPNSQHANVSDLALLALRVASLNASHITEHIKVSVDNASLEPAVQQGLADCMDLYVDAAQQLDDSLAALLAGAYDDVRTWVNVAIADADACAAACKGHETVMSGKNEVFRKLCENVLTITRDLARK